jgi:hypothetical protein
LLASCQTYPPFVYLPKTNLSLNVLRAPDFALARSRIISVPIYWLIDFVKFLFFVVGLDPNAQISLAVFGALGRC